MASHMKTTLDIADPLLKAAKVAAQREGTTLRALVERGLKLVLRNPRPTRGFRLRDLSVTGQGLQPEATGRTWAELRDLTYRGRGD